MKRNEIERLIRERWRTAARLIATADRLMERCVGWPEKQSEPFDNVLFDMEAWRREAAKHKDALVRDINGCLVDETEKE